MTKSPRSYGSRRPLGGSPIDDNRPAEYVELARPSTAKGRKLQPGARVSGARERLTTYDKTGTCGRVRRPMRGDGGRAGAWPARARRTRRFLRRRVAPREW